MTMKGDPRKAPPMFVKGEDGVVRLNTAEGWSAEAKPDMIADPLKELMDAEIVLPER